MFGGGDSNLYAYVGSDPINRLDPSGLAPGDPYDSPGQAAVAWASDYYGESASAGKEYASGIYGYDTPEGRRFSYTPPRQGSGGKVDLRNWLLGPDATLEGTVHSHPPLIQNSDPYVASGSDKRECGQTQVPAYFATPIGIVYEFSDPRPPYSPSMDDMDENALYEMIRGPTNPIGWFWLRAGLSRALGPVADWF